MTWINLTIPCPVPGCARSDSDTGNWYHRSCGQIVELSDEARIRCSRCNISLHIKNWGFICASHGGTPEDTDETTFINAVLMANKFKNINDSFAINLVNYLFKNKW